MPNTEHTEINQFTVNPIVQVPCDAVFENLLIHSCVLKRPYDKTEGVRKTNEYGEVVLTYEEAQVIGTDIKCRIDPVRQRGELGFKIKAQGGEVFASFRAFFCPQIDILENDSIFIGAREYQVLLVDEFSNSTALHHKEVFLRRVDNL
jgi:hypothetical protein